MGPKEILPDETPTLSFDTFWKWLVNHPNCILRAGTRDTLLYDDDDYHWYFVAEGEELALVQLIRGKRLVGELFLAREQVAYVQGVSGEQEGEYVFELISESESERVALYFVVMSHGYEVEETTVAHPVH